MQNGVAEPITCYEVCGPRDESCVKRSVQQLTRQEVDGQVVLLRCDFNVPLSRELKVVDDTRIREALPTLLLLTAWGARVVVASHLGRPSGREPKASLRPVADHLLGLGVQVHFVADCVGNAVAEAVSGLMRGDVLLLENTRFHMGEEANDPAFAQQLAAHADLYVQDAFGCVHRAHASVVGVTRFLKPCVGGLLLQKELNYLLVAVHEPKRPFCAIVGGSKVSSKIGILRALIRSCDVLIIGGAMAFTFLLACGQSTGSSLVDHDRVQLAWELMAEAKQQRVQLLLPTDFVIAQTAQADAPSRTVSAGAIDAGWMGLDIGPQSCKDFATAMGACKTLLWNGPMGVFEVTQFSAGTHHIASQMAQCTARGATTIIGGGDSVAAVAQAGLQSRMSHISTGGGATLELLEGRVLPGVAALADYCPRC